LIIDVFLFIMPVNNPLVSIIVITYNSAKYVLETLESTKAQTYKNIELIITDDCSTDNTIELCTRWIEENQVRFARARLILSNINTGVAPNCNRGLKEATGQWVKFIAGDDILTDECIYHFVNYTKINPQAYFIFGSVIPFSNDTRYKPYLVPQKVFSLTAKQQHKLLLKKGCFVPAAGNFMKIDIINACSGFDERFPMCEDYPFWLKVTGLGYKLHFYNFNCVKYRIHSENLTISISTNNRVNPIFMQSLCGIRLLVIIPLLLKNRLYFSYINFKMQDWRDRKKGPGLNKYIRYLSYCIDPRGVYIKILRILHIQYYYGIKLIKETHTKI
jgi:glycosyltransferase involved in cell wall biosynthesis